MKLLLQASLCLSLGIAAPLASGGNAGAVSPTAAAPVSSGCSNNHPSEGQDMDLGSGPVDFSHPFFLADVRKSGDDEAGFVSLFDGKTLGKWEGDPRLWSVRDGALTGQTTKENPAHGNTFLIYKGGEPADCELRMKMRYDSGNSGVQFRSKHLEGHKDNAWVLAGYQADAGGGKDHNGKIYEEKARGYLSHVGETVIIHPAEAGDKADKKTSGFKREVVKTDPEAVKISEGIKNNEWFDYVIIARGNHLVTQINGHTIVDLTDEQKDKAASSGLIGIQIHAGGPMTVQVKDVRLKELK